MICRIALEIRCLPAEVRWLVATIGYWIRPYDMLADARRWFWQKPQPCARMTLFTLCDCGYFPCPHNPT